MITTMTVFAELATAQGGASPPPQAESTNDRSNADRVLHRVSRFVILIEEFDRSDGIYT